jgi:hypothetical protein
MSKRFKVLASVLVAVLLLTVAGTATMVMAQEEEEDQEVTTQQVEVSPVLARVAEILGIPEEDLINAFEQAQQEMMEERMEEAFDRALDKLDKAVEEGLLTQEEADEIKEWWEQKPEVIKNSMLRRIQGFKALRGRQMSDNTGAVWNMRPEMRQRPLQEIRQWPGQGIKQPPGQMKLKPWQGIRQKLGQGMNGEWQQLGPPWLTD